MLNYLKSILHLVKIHPIKFWIIIIIILFFARFIFNRIKKNDNSDKKNDFLSLFNFKKIIYTLIFTLFGFILGWNISSNYENNLPIPENINLTNSIYTFGIDISHYQGHINWSEVRTSHHPIEYVFIRATMGVDGKDKEFQYNWDEVNDKGYIRGAYHFYRPNENSTEQFQNYSSSVNLSKGDFIPILDIEQPSRFGDINLREGILNWLKLAEEKYGVKPIIYTGRDFYNKRLKNFIDGYPLWIASYSGKQKMKNIDWSFHQFTEGVKIKGIKTSVDGNDYKKDLVDLKKMCIK